MDRADLDVVRLAGAFMLPTGCPHATTAQRLPFGKEW